MRAVIVGPDEDFLKMLETLFEGRDIEIVKFRSAHEALGFLRTSTSDLICSMSMLDDMSCLEFSQEVRKIPSAVLIPLVMIPPKDTTVIYSDCLKSGVTEVFSVTDLKPLSHYITNITERRSDGGVEPGRILYFETEYAAAHRTADLLRQNGYEVHHFFRLDEALRAFEDEAYDLVLTEVSLHSGTSGLTLVRAINTNPDNKHTPIIAMSRVSDPGQRVPLLHAGANDYATKPLVAGELLARVRNMLANKRLYNTVQDQKRRMQEIIMTDQLTGLYNRRYLGDIAPKYLSKACRHQFDLSLLLIDLDHFRQVNDTYGHKAGDIVLQEVANVLKGFGRKEDIIARFGEEEFVVLLTHCSSEDACKRAEVLRKQIEALKPAGLTVTCSIGVTTIGMHNELDQCSFEKMFSAADKAVFSAKEAGRNCIRTGQIESD